jgi:hypothetical protein
MNSSNMNLSIKIACVACGSDDSLCLMLRGRYRARLLCHYCVKIDQEYPGPEPTFREVLTELDRYISRRASDP